MGTFIGHVYPGLVLFVFGLYQAVVVSRAVIFNDSLLSPLCTPKNKGRWARLRQIPYTGLLKVVAGFLLLVNEHRSIIGGLVLMSRSLPPRFLYPKEWQHVTMFILLMLSGCVDIMSKALLPRRCVALEKGTLALSLYELLLLLVSHVKDVVGVELQVHSLLILVVFLSMLVLTAQLCVPEMPHLWLTETFLFLIMGSWLVQAGFILYSPPSGYRWDDDDISDVMFVTTFFCWHVIVDALCLVGIYGFSSFWYHWYRPSVKLMGPPKAPHPQGSPGDLYRLLQGPEQPEKEDQPLLSSSP